MGTITGANSIIMIAITGLFPVPFQLSGFAADDVFDTDSIESSEVLMGVDGNLSGGWVAVPVQQTYKIQADSPSVFFFDTWWATQQQLREAQPATGVVTIKTVGRKWTMTRGFLTMYTPIPANKKLLQPLTYRVTWESVFPALA